jgi:hypothetical protein
MAIQITSGRRRKSGTIRVSLEVGFCNIFHIKVGSQYPNNILATQITLFF